MACGIAIGTLAACPAAAQPKQSAAPASQPSPVVPPHLALKADVEYPAEGHGNAVVVLSLTIDAGGTVRQAEAIEGEEPFASTAERAALTWFFEPATRNGLAVASVVQFEVSFVEPTPPAETNQAAAPQAQGSAAMDARSNAEAEPSPGTSPTPKTLEVTVQGQRQAPAVSSFSRAEARQLPGAFGDPFRAIEALPGVTPTYSGLPFFYVRGAPPGNVGYFLDNVRIPYQYHVGLGPSVIHPAMVERVDLYSGGYPARFGRFAGGIVSGEATAPRTDFHGEGNIRVFDLEGSGYRVWIWLL